MLQRVRRSRRLTNWGAMLLGGSLAFGGCDPTIQATLEDGVINVSTSFLAAVLQAVANVAAEQ
jgi:hypothetical protein